MSGKFVYVMLLIIAVIGYTLLVRPSSGFTLDDDDVKVGFYYYVWYEGVYGEGHWNGTPPKEPESLRWKIVDTPILGFYNSQDTTIIKQHLEWFKELDVDFLIVSWWGPYSFPDNTTKIIFSIVEQEDYSIEVALMVEAYNWSGVYNFKTIYDYIYDTYVSSYESVYMKLDDLPLVCFYNDLNMTKTQAQRDAIYSDSRFTACIVGHNDVDWWFAIPCSVANSSIPPLSPRDGMICIEPRYDDQFLGRDKNSTFNENLAEGLYDLGLYDFQWSEAIRLAEEGRVNYVTMYSWNEYHERSQVEPHISTDGRYILSPFYKTKRYTQTIHKFYYSANKISLALVISAESLIFLISLIHIAVHLKWKKIRYKILYLESAIILAIGLLGWWQYKDLFASYAVNNNLHFPIQPVDLVFIGLGLLLSTVLLDFFTKFYDINRKSLLAILPWTIIGQYRFLHEFAWVYHYWTSMNVYINGFSDTIPGLPKWIEGFPGPEYWNPALLTHMYALLFILFSIFNFTVILQAFTKKRLRENS